MNLRSVVKHTIADWKAGNAVKWESPPGFGKTEKVARLIEWARTEFPGKRVGFTVQFMATASPIALTGLPWKGELLVKDFDGVPGNDHRYTITEPAIPEWYIATDVNTGARLPANLFDVVILVLEEWGQGELETKRAGAELLRAGRVGDWALPKDNFRLALSNSDKRDGVTKEFDFVINRMSIYTVNGDATVWLEDFADKPYSFGGRQWLTMPATKAWAKQNPGILFEAKPKEQGPWCTPRSLAATDRYAQAVAEATGGKVPVNDPEFVEGVTAKIGMAAGMSYVGHLQFALDLPSYESVVADPQGTPVPVKGDLQMLMAYEMAGRTQPQDLAPVIEYMNRSEMPKDMRITFVTSLLRRDYKAFVGEPAMKAWIAKNAPLVSIIQSLAVQA